MTPVTNITKTDEQIKTSVVSELEWDIRVDASHVKVEVDNGVVTLTGQVPSLGAKFAAGEAAWSVLGVVNVNNRLSIALPATPDVPGDDEIRNIALTTMEWNPDIDSINIDVEVELGIVKLTGTVPTHWSKTRAQELVGNLRGVVDVINELAVTPTGSISDEVIAEDIVAALERNVLVDAERVDVTVTGGVVTLAGSVSSGAADLAAHRAASRTTGVVRVNDELVVRT